MTNAADKSPRCDLKRCMGAFGDPDERDCPNDLQPVRENLNLPNARNDFVEIMEMMDKRLNDKGKNWRHVFKVGHVPYPES